MIDSVDCLGCLLQKIGILGVGRVVTMNLRHVRVGKDVDGVCCFVEHSKVVFGDVQECQKGGREIVEDVGDDSIFVGIRIECQQQSSGSDSKGSGKIGAQLREEDLFLNFGGGNDLFFQFLLEVLDQG